MRERAEVTRGIHYGIEENQNLSWHTVADRTNTGYILILRFHLASPGVAADTKIERDVLREYKYCKA